MRNQFRARILAAIREKIADKSETYIGDACDAIAHQDHRRKVHDICASIKREVAQDLAPHETVEAYLLQNYSDVTPHQARLNWIDDAIKRCALLPEPANAGN